MTPRDPIPVSQPDPAHLARLRERLAADADDADALDVGYRFVDSPIGRLLLAATSQGLLRVGFTWERSADDELQWLADNVSPRILPAPRRLDAAAREIDEYFAGGRTDFDLPLDMRLSRGFRLEVLAALRRVPYGVTESYAGLAADAGRPRAVRATATACATNPIPLVIPCHRIVRSDGSMGEYGGGADRKEALLRLEGVTWDTR